MMTGLKIKNRLIKENMCNLSDMAGLQSDEEVNQENK